MPKRRSPNSGRSISPERSESRNSNAVSPTSRCFGKSTADSEPENRARHLPKLASRKESDRESERKSHR